MKNQLISPTGFNILTEKFVIPVKVDFTNKIPDRISYPYCTSATGSFYWSPPYATSSDEFRLPILVSHSFKRGFARMQFFSLSFALWSSFVR